MSPELSKEFLESLAELNKGTEDYDFSEDEQIPTFTAKGGGAHALATLLRMIQDYEQARLAAGNAKWFDPEGPYPIDVCVKHKAFFDAGSQYPERLFMAANRVGKSIAGAYETACHLTGIYPSWWAGRVFDTHTQGWAMGPDARTVRDTIQKELVGALGEWGTGMIPAHLLGKASALQGTPGAIDTLKVKHVTGRWSELGFKNYKQDILAFMGTSRHFVWADEECPIEIWNESNIRTATTNGIMYATFTPLQGLTRMVVNFCKKADFLVGARPIVALEADSFEEDDNWNEEEAEEVVGNSKKKAVIQAGWDDAPWLTKETRARLLEDTPEHLKDARSKGIPSMGAGAVFPTPLESVLVDPFSIPDTWPRMYGLDVGWNKTACVWAALDPNTDTLYFYDEHYQGEQQPQHHAFAIKSRGEWIRGVIDPATRGRSQADGNKLFTMYKALGLRLIPAKNERESGIQLMNQRLSTGKLKVFRTLNNFSREYILYKRELNGKIKDENDHALDAARYVVNNLNRMSSKADSRIGGTIKYVPTAYNV